MKPSDPGQHADWLPEDFSLGFSQLSLHNINRQQQGFIGAFGTPVLPQLKQVTA